MRNFKAIIKGIQDHNAMSDEPKKDIDFSKRLSSDEEKILNQLKNSKNFKPNPGKSEKGFFDRVRDFMG